MTNEVIKPANQAPVVLDEAALALMAQAAPTPDFKRDDLLIPYLVIVQNTSPYVQRNDPLFIADAHAGDITDTLTLKLRAVAAVIPCKFERHYTTWKPNQGGLVKQWFTNSTAYDAAGEDFGTRKDAEGNDIVPTNVYYNLLLDEEAGTVLPIITSMAGTQFKKARRWNALIASLELRGPDGPFVAPIYSRIYHLSTVPESNDQGSWMGWKIEPGPLTLTHPDGRALFARAAEFRKAIESGVVRPATPPTASGETMTEARPRATVGGEPDLEDNIPFD